MNYVAYFQNGHILQCGSCQENELRFQGGLDTHKMEVPEPIDPNAFYVADGALVPMPPRPSPHHDFNYDTKQWEPNHARAWASVRYERDTRITATDWRVTRAQEAGQLLAQPWAQYRQALRDVTQQADPINIVWPVEPV